MITPQSSIGLVHLPTVRPGFKHGAAIAWTPIDAPDCDLHIPADITFNEADLVVSQPVIVTLRKFGGLADSIIQLFE